MPRKRAAIPEIHVHPKSDLFYVRLPYPGGRREMVYLGRAGTDEPAAKRTALAADARRKYELVIAKYLSGERREPEDSTRRQPVVGELVLAYLDWLKKTDRSDGQKKYLHYRNLLRPLNDLFSDMPIEEFRVRHLIAVRNKMLAEVGQKVIADPEEYKRAQKVKRANAYRASKGLPLLPTVEVQMMRRPPSITTINDRISQIRTVFKKGVSFDLVTEEKVAQLRLLDGLVIGESDALNPKTIPPVPMEDFFKTLAEVGPVIRAMMILQIVTGMRSGELVRLKKIHLRKKANGIWEYEPKRHKTQRIRKGKRVPIGGDVIDELRRLIDFDEAGEDEYLFSPRTATILYRQKRAENRKTAARKSKRKVLPHIQPGERYTASSYCRAIQRAAIRAGVPVWHPHQLRHNAATIIDQHFDKEAVMTVLGHLNEKTSEGYIDYNEKKADAVASAIHSIIFPKQ